MDFSSNGTLDAILSERLDHKSYNEQQQSYKDILNQKFDEDDSNDIILDSSPEEDDSFANLADERPPSDEEDEISISDTDDVSEIQENNEEIGGEVSQLDLVDDSIEAFLESDIVGETSSSQDAVAVQVAENIAESQKEKPKSEKKEKAQKKRKKDKSEDGPKKKRTRKAKDKDGEKGEKKKRKNKKVFERKNIRDIMENKELDQETLAAQQEERERKQRLQELRENIISTMQQKKQEAAKHSELKCLLEADTEEKPANQIKVKEEKPEIKIEVIPLKEEKSAPEASSSDDDCVILSSDHEEEEDAGGEDFTNSGSHTNDSMNQPDVEGRVLVNVGHPPDEPDIFLAKQLSGTVKPHQIGGIRFLYDNLVESLERYKTSNGFGCILAHSMGLGKTIQLISFIDVFLRYTAAHTVLCIVPVNTLQNWQSEFNMWLPTEESLMDEDKDKVEHRKFNVYMVNDNHKTNTARANVVENWQKNGGCLLMGYEMYRLLSSRRIGSSKPRRSKKTMNEPIVIDLDEEDRNKELMHKVHAALMRPGPDLVICDEGHRIKNSHASTSQALKNIRTKRRVVLTGYPLQNNLIEYWCMVDFVRPNFLGTRAEFSNMFERPITNGQCIDSTPEDSKLMRYRAHVLHSLLEGFVQRRGHSVLTSSLPHKTEFVLMVRMSPVQRKLYTEFMTFLKNAADTGWARTNPIKAFSVCCKIWNHPDVFYKQMRQRKIDENDLDFDLNDNSAQGENSGKKGKGKGLAKKSSATSSPVQQKRSDSPYVQEEPPMPTPEKKDQAISFDWANNLLDEYMEGLEENGGKIVLLHSIIEESLKIGDKLLVFSQSLFTLNLIEEYLARQKVPIPECSDNWEKNKNYFRLDGSTSSFEREKMINMFNAPDNNRLHLFLLSTRAGCLGINLTGANRVVIFDASWNPCHDAQAMCRVYRYGQQKPCFIYRLVSDNTMEKKIYERQINKQGMSDRVVDELNPENQFTRRQVDQLLHYEDKDMEFISAADVKNVTDEVLLRVLKHHDHWITRLPFQHESLLVDKKEKRLTKTEKRLAKQGYEMEKKMNISYSRPSYSAFYPKNDSRLPSQNSMHSMSTGRPVASVRPMMSTPVPMEPRGSFNPGGPQRSTTIPINSLLKPGVSVHQVKTTTAITIPGTSTSTDSSNKIPAGENVLVIKTPKGVYIRTPQGKLFAIRSKMGEQPPCGISTTAGLTSSTTTTESSSVSSQGANADMNSKPATTTTTSSASYLASQPSITPENSNMSADNTSDTNEKELPELKEADIDAVTGKSTTDFANQSTNEKDEDSDEVSIVGEKNGHFGGMGMQPHMPSPYFPYPPTSSPYGNMMSGHGPPMMPSMGMPPPYGMPGHMPWGYPMWDPRLPTLSPQNERSSNADQGNRASDTGNSNQNKEDTFNTNQINEESNASKISQGPEKSGGEMMENRHGNSMNMAGMMGGYPFSPFGYPMPPMYLPHQNQMSSSSASNIPTPNFNMAPGGMIPPMLPLPAQPPLPMHREKLDEQFTESNSSMK